MRRLESAAAGPGAWIVAALGLGLVALKAKSALAAGIDVPADPDWPGLLSAGGIDGWITAMNGQWDPLLLRLAHGVGESLLSAAAVWLVARFVAPAGAFFPVLLLGGAAQLLLALGAPPPPLVFSWLGPWAAVLACLVPIALLAGLQSPSAGRSARRPTALAALVLLTIGLWQAGAFRASPADPALVGEPRGAAFRESLAAPGLAQRMDPGIRALLPFSARPALPAGDWVRSDFGHVTVRARPAPGGAATAAPWMRLGDGRRLVPLQEGGLAPDGSWRRFNFSVPAEPFRIEAEPGVELGPVLEYAAGSRVAGKLASAWPFVAALAALLGAVGLWRARALPWEALAMLRWTGPERRWIPWIALAGYLAVVACFLDTYAGGADSSGYLNSARMLSRLECSEPLRPADLEHPPAGVAPLPASLHVPPGYSLAPTGGPLEGRMVPTYPVGLPLMIAAAQALLPDALALPMVLLGHLLAAVLLCQALGRLMGLSPSWSRLLAAVVALCPITLFMGSQPMSDVPAMVWVTAAMVAALASRNDEGRPAPRWASLLPWIAGAATGMAVLVRPANLLVMPALVIALWGSPRRLLAWTLGGLPFAVFSLWYNQHLYGNALSTGYGDVGGLFSLDWVPGTLLHYLLWLPIQLTPALLAGLALPFLGGIALRRRLVPGAWALAFLGFYAAYACTHETWWYTRFLLPAIPALAVAAMLAVRELAGGLEGRVGRIAAAAALAWILAADLRIGVLDSADGNRSYRDFSLWMADQVPANALVACDHTAGALHHYTSLSPVMPTSAGDAERILEVAKATGRPLYAACFSFDDAMLAHFRGGRWTRLHEAGWIGVWRWDESASSGR